MILSGGWMKDFFLSAIFLVLGKDGSFYAVSFGTLDGEIFPLDGTLLALDKDGSFLCGFFRDAGWRNFFLLMFRFQKAGSSKFSASRFWLRTDRRLMPWRFWLL